ncbi:MAG: 2-C-methyl-D-erythritol 4-phosphate cytidylyltransferase [candidate division WOR-3 bacterium]|nr:MAG: 2-C-methyl-D-erythritol 4-phosphate cytidylyltransferase [candidate division WOR-3 bacterium]
MAVHAIVVAAGAGRRFGNKKQFVRVHGRPLFAYATGVLDRHEKVKTITLVVPKRDVRRAGKIAKDLGLNKVRYIVGGGKRRQDSVARGLRTIRQKSGIVIIHDAVRPLITTAMITRGIATCRKHKAVILGVRAHDTVKRIAGSRVQETVSRKDLFLVQTPQFYDLKTIKRAMAAADFSAEYTDEAALLESIGMPVHICKGDRHNIKVTDRRDLRYVAKFLT